MTLQSDLQTHLFDFLLQWADTSLILGQRLSEWCGHGPILEQDIAMTNIALDYIGEARNVYQYAAEVENAGRAEDDLAYLRGERDFKNLLLVEQPNGDFGQTVARLFFYEAFHLPWLLMLKESKDDQMAAIAEKSAKEAAYHWQWSSEWVIRLGDGTEESHSRLTKAVEELWPYCGELTIPSPADLAMAGERIAPDVASLKDEWQQRVSNVLQEATLSMPDADIWMHRGGREGLHTEHLGYILAEMQHLQRTYPGNSW